jgi:hypothetical protein
MFGRVGAILAIVLATGACGSNSGSGTGGTSGGGSGGSAHTGGSGGGGAAGSAGQAGGAGGSCTLPGTTLATFNSDVEGFSYNTDGSNNLAGAGADGGTLATLAFSAAEGDPCPGSLQAMIPFSAPGQQVQIVKDFGQTSLQDWTGKTLHVRVKVASGFETDPATPPGMQAYVTSYAPVDGGSPQYLFSGQYQNIQPGNGWNEYTYSMAGANYSSPGFDISKIENFGVILQTPANLTIDATAPAPTPAVVYVDSFYLTN